MDQQTQVMMDQPTQPTQPTQVMDYDMSADDSDEEILTVGSDPVPPAPPSSPVFECSIIMTPEAIPVECEVKQQQQQQPEPLPSPVTEPSTGTADSPSTGKVDGPSTKTVDGEESKLVDTGSVPTNSLSPSTKSGQPGSKAGYTKPTALAGAWMKFLEMLLRHPDTEALGTVCSTLTHYNDTLRNQICLIAASMALGFDTEVDISAELQRLSVAVSSESKIDDPMSFYLLAMFAVPVPTRVNIHTRRGGGTHSVDVPKASLLPLSMKMIDLMAHVLAHAERKPLVKEETTLLVKMISDAQGNLEAVLSVLSAARVTAKRRAPSLSKSIRKLCDDLAPAKDGFKDVVTAALASDLRVSASAAAAAASPQHIPTFEDGRALFAPTLDSLSAWWSAVHRYATILDAYPRLNVQTVPLLIKRLCEVHNIVDIWSDQQFPWELFPRRRRYIAYLAAVIVLCYGTEGIAPSDITVQVTTTKDQLQLTVSQAPGSAILSAEVPLRSAVKLAAAPAAGPSTVPRAELPTCPSAGPSSVPGDELSTCPSNGPSTVPGDELSTCPSTGPTPLSTPPPKHPLSPVLSRKRHLD
jgi:hypothetical protein